MANQIKVVVAGAAGKMGKEVVKMVLAEPQFELVGAIGRSKVGEDIGRVIGISECNVLITDQLAETLRTTQADVLVDFTTPSNVLENTKIAIECGVRPVIGTTGFSAEEIDMLIAQCEEKKLGGIIAPNFSIGAILMMKFAAQAAKYLPHVEIMEFHGEQKLDAPSGTAVKTAEMISQNRQQLKQGHPNAHEMIEGSRGGEFDGFRIHSIRLPGLFAQQEVMFGGFGQTLKIRHDSYERSAYMPGVREAVLKAMELDHLVYGFDKFID